MNNAKCSFVEFDLWEKGVMYKVKFVDFTDVSYSVEVSHGGKCVWLFPGQAGVISMDSALVYLAGALMETTLRGKLYQND